MSTVSAPSKATATPVVATATPVVATATPVVAPVVAPLDLTLKGQIHAHELITLTKRQKLSLAIANDAKDASILATSKNKVLNTYGLGRLDDSIITHAVALITSGQFTKGCEIVDAWCGHEFGRCVGRKNTDLQAWFSLAIAKLEGTKATKTAERLATCLDRVTPIYNAMAVKMTEKQVK